MSIESQFLDALYTYYVLGEKDFIEEFIKLFNASV